MNDDLTWVLREYAHVDTDIAELAGLLRRTELPNWLAMFHVDLAEAIRSGVLTPPVVHRVMMREFDDQDALDAWLRRAWATWFPGEDYPA